MKTENQALGEPSDEHLMNFLAPWVIADDTKDRADFLAALRAALAAGAVPIQAPEGGPALSEDALTELIAEHMVSVYHCTRVWEAWHVGTMSQDDFEPYAESESPRELAQAIRAALAAQPAAIKPGLNPAPAEGDAEPSYADIRALIANLRRLEDPAQTELPTLDGVDGRALVGKCWRGLDWLLGEVDDLEVAKDEAERAPWPDWANQVLKVVREHSGYDGYDDADGVDIVEEVGECLRELAADAKRARDALAASKVQPKGLPVSWQARMFVGDRWTDWKECQAPEDAAEREVVLAGRVAYQLRPLFAEPVPSSAPEPALTDMQIDKLLHALDDVALNFGDDLPGLALNSRGLERSRDVVRRAFASPAPALTQVLVQCLRDFAAIAIEEESQLKPTAELVDALINESTPESPIGRMRDALAVSPAVKPERPTEPGWYVVLPPDFDGPTVRAFGKDGQWWIPLGKGNGDDGWMTGREYQNWVGPIAGVDDRQPFLAHPPVQGQVQP